ncbi:hypothetical protein SAMN05443245_2837 [Paraburkholderia fungorum]|uniref:DUF4148 domain-containing protein n=1 Tax=Paraburkholderia fungorum TaxID=134537 RepID=A0A1H1DX04_9BURK|nr:hypothetical protein [Paraburkholderia fungorum]SDQ80758.1 hypothetical protein SAMN05443245_2837 [Paraburkholderia fungorum]
MNRLVFAVRAACVASLSSLICASPAFAQADQAVQSDVIQHPATNFSSTTAAISDNFQYINHPPAPAVPASSPKSNGGGRGHRHGKMSGTQDSDGTASTQP